MYSMRVENCAIFLKLLVLILEEIHCLQIIEHSILRELENIQTYHSEVNFSC